MSIITTTTITTTTTTTNHHHQHDGDDDDDDYYDLLLLLPAALRGAERANARTCPELGQGNPCPLVVLGLRLGGGGPRTFAEFVRLLTRSQISGSRCSRCHTGSGHICARPAMVRAACHRCCSILCGQLLCLPPAAAAAAAAANVDGKAALLSDLLADSAEPPPISSRLP